MNALVLLYTYRDSIYDQVIDHFDKKIRKMLLVNPLK